MKSVLCSVQTVSICFERMTAETKGSKAITDSYDCISRGTDVLFPLVIRSIDLHDKSNSFLRQMLANSYILFL